MTMPIPQSFSLDTTNNNNNNNTKRVNIWTFKKENMLNIEMS